jgi:hypothetical protein
MQSDQTDFPSGSQFFFRDSGVTECQTLVGRSETFDNPFCTMRFCLFKCRIRFYTDIQVI